MVRSSQRRSTGQFSGKRQFTVARLVITLVLLGAHAVLSLEFSEQLLLDVPLLVNPSGYGACPLYCIHALNT